MSAYQVSDKTIATVLAIVTMGEYYENDAYQRQGDELAYMNAFAIATRYDEPIADVSFAGSTREWIDPHAISMGNASVIAPLIKTLDCYLYQCNEDKVSEWSIFRRCKSARAELVSQLLSGLPAYDKAPWA